VPEMVGNVTLYKTTAVEFAASAHELVEAGATFLGGCCGTTPEFIRVLAQHCRIESGERDSFQSMLVSRIRWSATACG